MKLDGSKLFEPIMLGAIALKNRVAMAPLTRSRATMEGVQPPIAAEYYAQRATAGLIIGEATNISRQGRGYAFTPGIYTAEQVAAWRAITTAVHARGGKIVCQLWHVGRMSHVSLQAGGAAPVAPSAIGGGELVYLESRTQAPPSPPRALTLAELPGLVDDYVHSARYALDAGFDGVEVHAANGYLLDQFIRDSTNHRTDAYGGTIEHRIRFPVEVVAAVAGAVGADRVGVRLSPITRAVGDIPLDSTPQETYGRLAQQLQPLGLAYLHCVEGQTRGANGASDFDFKRLSKQFGAHYIANNSYTRETAIQAVGSGYADVIAFGRPFIGNPDLPERLRLNAPLAESDPSTYYAEGAEGYTDYPALSPALLPA